MFSWPPSLLTILGDKMGKAFRPWQCDAEEYSGRCGLRYGTAGRSRNIQ